MADKKEKQLTIQEKWAEDSKLPNGGVGFDGKPDPEAAAKVVLEGFTDEELAELDRIGNTDEIEEV